MRMLRQLHLALLWTLATAMLPSCAHVPKKPQGPPQTAFSNILRPSSGRRMADTMRRGTVRRSLNEHDNARTPSASLQKKNALPIFTRPTSANAAQMQAGYARPGTPIVKITLQKTLDRNGAKALANRLLVLQSIQTVRFDKARKTVFAIFAADNPPSVIALRNAVEQSGTKLNRIAFLLTYNKKLDNTSTTDAPTDAEANATNTRTQTSQPR